MTGGQDHSGDAVRQLLAEIQQRRLAVIQPAGTKVGADEVLAAIHDGGKLVAALTAVLDRCQELEQFAKFSASDYDHGSAHAGRVIARAVAAALEEQP